MASSTPVTPTPAFGANRFLRRATTPIDAAVAPTPIPPTKSIATPKRAASVKPAPVVAKKAAAKPVPTPVAKPAAKVVTSKVATKVAKVVATPAKTVAKKAATKPAPVATKATIRDTKAKPAAKASAKAPAKVVKKAPAVKASTKAASVKKPTSVVGKKPPVKAATKPAVKAVAAKAGNKSKVAAKVTKTVRKAIKPPVKAKRPSRAVALAKKAELQAAQAPQKEIMVVLYKQSDLVPEWSPSNVFAAPRSAGLYDTTADFSPEYVERCFWTGEEWLGATTGKAMPNQTRKWRPIVTNEFDAFAGNILRSIEPGTKVSMVSYGGEGIGLVPQATPVMNDLNLRTAPSQQLESSEVHDVDHTFHPAGADAADSAAQASDKPADAVVTDVPAAVVADAAPVAAVAAERELPGMDVPQPVIAAEVEQESPKEEVPAAIEEQAAETSEKKGEAEVAAPILSLVQAPVQETAAETVEADPRQDDLLQNVG